ncbi:MAG TPA: hypothetical protein VE844_04905, partial [Gammaproteobacteria bacterium]|nr:hypothetical protein [Gammaproteobacteria bacterium]
ACESFRYYILRLLESEMVLDGLFIDDFKGSPQVCDRTFGNLLRSHQCFADRQTDWKFCHKYGFEPNDRQSYPPFDEKLRTKQACINTVYC